MPHQRKQAKNAQISWRRKPHHWEGVGKLTKKRKKKTCKRAVECGDGGKGRGAHTSEEGWVVRGGGGRLGSGGQRRTRDKGRRTQRSGQTPRCQKDDAVRGNGGRAAARTRLEHKWAKRVSEGKTSKTLRKRTGTPDEAERGGSQKKMSEKKGSASNPAGME